MGFLVCRLKVQSLFQVLVMRILEYKRVVKRKWLIGLILVEEIILKVLYFQILMRYLRLELVIFLVYILDRVELY